MTTYGWLQIALVLGLTGLAAFPLGAYIARVMQGGQGWLHPVLAPVERLCYRLAGIDHAQGMGWRVYVGGLLLLNLAHFLVLYALLRLQGVLPFNPAGIGAMAPATAFNTAISFVTNTNWQAYSGESGVSYFTQMLGLTVHNFLSAATGIAAAMAVSRAFAAGGVTTLGNLWADLVRATLYILLPLSVVVAVALIASGVPMSMAAYPEAMTLEGVHQVIALGPMAFQEAIKLLGTNGGGFLNANSAHPFENPSAFTAMLECICIAVIPFALAVGFGHVVGDRRQGRALFAAMMLLVVAAVAALYATEAAGNPLLSALDASGGNMEGKEVRFGMALTALFSVLTTGTSCGAVIAMHDSFTPLGGMVVLFMIQLGEVLPGGVGSGLYGILVFALLAVFVAGLMVGRTPEYLGKKVQSREIKLAMLAVLILPLTILGGTAISLVLPSGLASLANAGPHGLSEMLYAWSSAAGNNGSAFAGLSADTSLLDFGLGAAMLLGRFATLVPIMALAGSLAQKPKLADGAGTLPTHGPLFIGLLIGVILILGGLQFLPALSLGPLAEHFAMLSGSTF